MGPEPTAGPIPAARRWRCAPTGSARPLLRRRTLQASENRTRWGRGVKVTDSKLQEYAAAFRESGGYLNFASYGPPSRQVEETSAELLRTAAGGAVGASEQLHLQDLRARQAFSRLSGFPLDRVGLLPYTSLGLFQVAFGIRAGTVLVGAGEFPANLYPWLRATGLGLGAVHRLGEPGDRVTVELVEQALTSDTVALAVSAVDFRTGYRADLAGLREVLGPDRLLVVDGIQGFGAVDLDWAVADALVVGGQKWIRGGWGPAPWPSRRPGSRGSVRC
ncbi:aminotransferase class V-fold PLP-dependent enzyme [Arthrobacter frigidicola]|nr:aminotransferase class V-fold PLP-dependent enzyme [Arthrobacter frigidicola]